MRISDWSSDVCSSDLAGEAAEHVVALGDQLAPAARTELSGCAVAVGQRHRDQPALGGIEGRGGDEAVPVDVHLEPRGGLDVGHDGGPGVGAAVEEVRSEEHTSELQSLMRISYAVFRLQNKKARIQTKRRPNA